MKKTKATTSNSETLIATAIKRHNKRGYPWAVFGQPHPKMSVTDGKFILLRSDGSCDGNGGPPMKGRELAVYGIDKTPKGTRFKMIFGWKVNANHEWEYMWLENHGSTITQLAITKLREVEHKPEQQPFVIFC